MIRYLNEGCPCGCNQGCCPPLPQTVSVTGNFASTSNPACQSVATLGTAALGSATAQGGSVTFTPGGNTILLGQAGTYYLGVTGNLCAAVEGDTGIAFAVNGVQLPAGTQTITGTDGTPFGVATLLTVTAPTAITVINPSPTATSYENVSVTVFRLA